MAWEINLYVKPSAASRPRMYKTGGKMRSYYAGTYKVFRKDVSGLVPPAVRTAGITVPLEGSLEVEVEVVVPRPRTTKLPAPGPDVDNYMKAALDCLNGVAWGDDKQIVRGAVIKMWTEKADERGHIRVTIRRLKDEWLDARGARLLSKRGMW